MTTAEMVTRLRDLVDEDTASFFDDADIKQSLDSGQRMVASELFNKNPNHSALAPLKQMQLAQAYTVSTEPSTLWKLISVVLNSYPCRIRTGDRRVKENNSYLAGSTTDPFVYHYNSRFDFDPTPTSGTYDVEYYRTPSDLTSTDPNLREEAHEAIVQYAFGDLMRKQEKFQEELAAFEKYNNIMARL